MSEDGTIVLVLKAVGPNGETGSGRFEYPPSHPQYDSILKHLGGLKPGESKPVPPFEDEK
ncbi:MAG TPA: hypothetical protein PKC89_00435 [Pyrinomonadaceae bacterium]|nr:hypothetical protein [Pyrinomonadaceae bacterium]